MKIETRPDVVISDYMESTFLLEVAQADAVGSVIRAALKDAASGTGVVVHFGDVTTRSSCVARFLCDPLRELLTEGIPDRSLIIAGPLADLNEYEVQRALEGEGLCMVLRDSTGPRLLGKMGPAVRESYAALNSKCTVSSGDLMRAPLSLDIKTANARIGKLAGLGLLRRVGDDVLEGGGRRYLYDVVK